MLSLSSFRQSVASRSNVTSAVLSRALSTSESLKVSSSATSTPPAAAAKEERIKYFKIYRWDPDHRQKPVSISKWVSIPLSEIMSSNIPFAFCCSHFFFITQSTYPLTP